MVLEINDSVSSLSKCSLSFADSTFPLMYNLSEYQMKWFLIFKYPLGDEKNEDKHYLVDSFLSEAKAKEICGIKNNDPRNAGYTFYILEAEPAELLNKEKR